MPHINVKMLNLVTIPFHTDDNIFLDRDTDFSSGNKQVIKQYVTKNFDPG